MSSGWPTGDTTRISITAEEGAARTASISYKLKADTLDLEALIGGEVVVTFTGFANGVASGATLFTGTVLSASYQLDSNEVTLSCSDNLQAVVNRMSNAEIEALVPGQWHDAVFGDERPSGWDYLQVLLESAPGTVELDAYGRVRYTPWAGSGGALTISTDSMVCDGQNVSASRAFSSPVNSVLITVNHRYELLRGSVMRYQYDYGDTCQWHETSKRMMPYQMLVDALGKDGRLLRAFSAKFLEPPGVVCSGIAWIGDRIFKLVRACGFILEDRWAQQVTEEVQVLVTNQASISKYGENRDELRVGIEVEADVEGWVEPDGAVIDPDAIGPEMFATVNPDINATVYPGMEDADVGNVASSELGSVVANMGDYAAVNDALAVAVAVARNRIKEAHRIGRVSARTKLNPFVDVDKVASIDAGKVSASGKIGQVVFDIDVENCSAMMTTTLFTTIAQGGSDTQPMEVVPPGDAEYPACAGSYDVSLPTVVNGGEKPAEDFSGLWFSGAQTDEESDMRFAIADPGAADECTQHWEFRREDQDQVIGVEV